MLHTFTKCLKTFSKCLKTFSKCLNTFLKCINTYSKCLKTFAKYLKTISKCLKTFLKCLCIKTMVIFTSPQSLSKTRRVKFRMTKSCCCSIFPSTSSSWFSGLLQIKTSSYHPAYLTIFWDQHFGLYFGVWIEQFWRKSYQWHLRQWVSGARFVLSQPALSASPLLQNWE